MDHPSNLADTESDAGTSHLDASTSREEPANTVRIDVRGTLDQASRPSLVQMVHELRSRGFQCHINVHLSRAARVESAALAGLREDLNAAEGGSGTAEGGVSLVLTAEDISQDPASSTHALLPGTAAASDGSGAVSAGGSPAPAQPPVIVLTDLPLAEYSDDELFAASDAAFALLDDPGTVGGADLLGRYSDIGEEIVRRSPLRDLLDPAGASPHAESPSVR